MSTPTQDVDAVKAAVEALVRGIAVLLQSAAPALPEGLAIEIGGFLMVVGSTDERFVVPLIAARLGETPEASRVLMEAARSAACESFEKGLLGPDFMSKVRVTIPVKAPPVGDC